MFACLIEAFICNPVRLELKVLEIWDWLGLLVIMIEVFGLNIRLTGNTSNVFLDSYTYFECNSQMELKMPKLYKIPNVQLTQ